MKDQEKTKEQLINELVELHQRVAELEATATERKRAEEALRESKQLLERTFASILDAIFIIDADTTEIMDCNPTASEIFGYSRQEMLGRTTAFLHVDEAMLKEFSGHLYRAVEEKGFLFLPEFRMKRRDGTVFPTEHSMMPLEDEHGKRVGWVSVVRDITERKRGEEQTKQLQEYLQLRIERMPIGSITWDTEFRVTSWNPAAEKIFGFTAQEALGKHPYDLIVPKEAQPHVDDIWRRLLEGDTTAHSINENVTKDGRTIICQWANTPLRKADGTVVGVLSMVQDITERKRAEEALRALTSRYEAILDAVPDIIMEVDADKVYTWANQAGFEFFGEAVLGKEAAFYFEGEQDTYETVQPLFDGDENVIYVESWQRRQDGEKRLLAWWCRVLKDANGNVTGALSTARDITERVRAEEKLREYREHLEELVAQRTAELRDRMAEVERLNLTMTYLLEDLQAAKSNMEETARKLQEVNEELEAFAYSVSHDLRAPLRAIDGLSRILLEEYQPQLSPEAQRYLQLVRDNTRQMGRLIDDLLTFSRLGRQRLEKQPVAPADLVRQALEDLRRQREGRRIEMTIGDLPVCQAAPALLKQVFVNLLSNALKFTRQREVVMIEIGCQDESGEQVYFVKDNGVGFDMRYVNKLFGVFQRLHRAEDYEGTGVGLAIVQRIIHRHGGRVWAEAKVDKGATFYFTLEGGTSHD